MEKLHYSLNHYFTHMLLWFKEFVTAAGIDASLWNTVTQCAIGACVCEWNMSHSASVNRSDSPVTLLYTACYVTRDVPFFIRTLNIFWGVFWLSAGSAGDWFSHGEEGDGAQTRNHSAEGEFLYLFFSDWPNKNCLVLWDEMLERRKLNEKVAKKFRLLASLDHFQLLLLRSFFYVSVSVQTVFSCLPSHTHTWHYPESESPLLPVCHRYISVIEKASDRLDGLKLYTG